MKAIIFDAFGTLFKITNGGSARFIMSKMTENGVIVDKNVFLDKWKSYYKKCTDGSCGFNTERDIFVSRIQMFYNRYNIIRNAGNDADFLLAEAFKRDVYPETKAVIEELMSKYKVFIGSNTDNDVIESVISNNNITVQQFIISSSQNLDNIFRLVLVILCLNNYLVHTLHLFVFFLLDVSSAHMALVYIFSFCSVLYYIFLVLSSFYIN